MKIVKQILNSNYLIYSAIIIIGVFWFAVTYQQYYDFAFRVGDSAVAENALWNTIHGEWFYQSFLNASNNFREHLGFVQVWYLPLYYLFPHTLTLFAIIQVSFVVAGILLYRFALFRIGKPGAIIVTALFLLHPLVASQVVGPMHVVAIGGPFFLLMLMAYMKKHYTYFIIGILLLVFLSEFAAPTIFMVGLLALWDRRGWKWFVPPFIGGIALYMAAKYYITIGFGKHDNILSHFKPEAIKNIYKLPKRLEFVGDFLKPMLYIFPFFSRYAILLAPSMILAIFIVVPGRLKGGAHIFIFVPAILSIIFIDLAMRWSGWKRNLLYVATVLGILLSLTAWAKWMEIDGSIHADTLRSALVYVRDGGSLTSDPQTGPHLCRRREFYLPANKKYSDYAVLKLSKNSKDKDKKLGDGNRYIDTLAKTGEYIEVFRDGRIIVLIKKEKLSQLLNKSIPKIEQMSQEGLQQELLEIPITDSVIK
ncbi:MAG TPA: DUF2079 domain-containing protein [Candidatus Pacebacteria bacterium]|nr:DUF2079 domain-containing protein [Candidatus Paceibacterota bacterium]